MKNTEKVIEKFGGGTSNITLYENYLVIKPSALSKMGGKGSEKTIPLSSVVNISIVKKLFKTPYLQVVTAGMIPDGKRDINRASDANVVLIQPGKMGAAKRIQKYVSEWMVKSAGTQPTTAGSPLDELEKLNDLKERGIITEEEFSAKKKDILGI